MDMADLATKLSNVPPTFLRCFFSPEEEDTLFFNDLDEEFVICSYLYFFSRHKLAKIEDYSQLTIPRYRFR